MMKRILGISVALLSLGRQADTKPLELALAKIDEAQRLAGQLNQYANALAA
jgi:hypothetical protein